ncbi:MAG: polymer-forming cytoskeletal protein [Geminicoccaceae bacterium]
MATAPVSVVAAHARLQGDLVSKGPIQLDGWVRGDVECPSLVIGQRGGVEGRVAADRLVVFGTIIGSVAAWTVILKATSKVIADILHDRLTVVEGAAFEGQCRRGNVRPGPHKTFPDAKRLALLAPGSR